LSVLLLVTLLASWGQSAFGQLIPPPDLEQIRNQELNIIGTTLTNEVALEVGHSAFFVAQSPTNWLNLGLDRLENRGPGFAEAAWTLGPEFPVSLLLNYVYLDYKKFDGEDIEDAFIEGIEFDPVDVGDSPLPGYTTRLDYEGEGGFETVRAQVLSLAATVGVFDRLDFSAIVPLVDVDVEGELGYLMQEEIFDPNGDLVASQGQIFSGGVFSDSNMGLGDVVLRLKYMLLQELGGDKPQPLTLSVGYDLKTPTGDEDELLGTGEVDHRVRVLMARTLFDGRVYPHLELGYLFSGTDDTPLGDSYDAFEYRFAAPVGVYAWRNEYEDLTGSLTISPELIGRISDVADKLDLGVSARLALGDSFLFQAGCRFPLKDDEGLIADFVPTVGVEYRF